MKEESEIWRSFKDGDMIVYEDDYIKFYFLFRLTVKNNPSIYCWQLWEKSPRITIKFGRMWYVWYVKRARKAMEKEMIQFREELSHNSDPVLAGYARKFLSETRPDK